MKLIENQTVANLRKQGFKVKVLHARNFEGWAEHGNGELKNEYDIRKQKLIFEPKGGKTTVTVTDPNGLNYIGISRCSDKDGFNRRFGLVKALGRLEQVVVNIV